jgi:hypothetical protein
MGARLIYASDFESAPLLLVLADALLKDFEAQPQDCQLSAIGI